MTPSRARGTEKKFKWLHNSTVPIYNVIKALKLAIPLLIINLINFNIES